MPTISHNSDAISRHHRAEQQSSRQQGAGSDGSTHCSLPTLVFHTLFTPRPLRLPLCVCRASQLVTGKQAQVGIQGQRDSNIPPKEAARASEFLTCLLAASEKPCAAEAMATQMRSMGEEIISRGPCFQRSQMQLLEPI